MKAKLCQHLLLISFGIILSFIAVTAQAVIPNQPTVNEPTRSVVKEPAASETSQLIGTWELIDYETRNSQGQVMRDLPWYYNRGLLMYDQAGRMAVQLVNDLRPGFPQGNLVEVVDKATPEELKRDVLGYFAYFGTYTFDVKKRTVTHHVEASTNNYAGTAQVRTFEIKGDQLILTKFTNLAQGASPGQLTSRIVWQRFK